MTIPFYKYHGTGNDFIMIDNREGLLGPAFRNQIPMLCHRHFGIGADGVILIQLHRDYDFEMVYYNPDGSQSLCGNGSRCAVAFARDLKMIKDKAIFLAYDGEHSAFIENDQIHLSMADIEKVDTIADDYFVNTGSPHYIKLVQSIQNFDVVGNGRKIRYTEAFEPNGTNVNFVELHVDDNALHIRTYERGVEDETMSCGTGVTAAALTASELGFQSPVSVHAQGGDLQVSFEKDAGGIYSNIYLIGPAVKVFQGDIEL
ncbi:diaminopimelate epimerase [Peijinzhouia sedimentorum]